MEGVIGNWLNDFVDTGFERPRRKRLLNLFFILSLALLILLNILLRLLNLLWHLSLILFFSRFLLFLCLFLLLTLSWFLLFTFCGLTLLSFFFLLLWSLFLFLLNLLHHRLYFFSRFSGSFSFLNLRNYCFSISIDFEHLLFGLNSLSNQVNSSVYDIDEGFKRILIERVHFRQVW